MGTSTSGSRASSTSSKNGGYTGELTTTGASGSSPYRSISTMPTLTSVATRTVRVADRTAPLIGPISATPNTLFYPTSTLWPVFINYSVTDAAGAPACGLAVSSNDLDDADNRSRGRGDRDIDWIVIGPHLVLLRAERAPKKGPQLLYTVTVTCADPSGNTSTGSVIVPVRKR